MTGQPIRVEARKVPQQRRSQDTVAAIRAATARVLATEGYARASTNRIAEVAGVSVGSLYQYFPNKDALVLAVADEHMRAMVELLEGSVARGAGGSIEALVRTFVDGMIAAHAIDPALHRALVQQILHLGVDVLRENQEHVRAMVEGWLLLRADEIRVDNVRVAAFILVSSVESVIHAAVFEKPELLSEPAFARELSRLVLRYLGVEGT